MPYQKMLFVEGADDRHALVHLLNRYEIDVCHFDEDEIALIEDPIAVKSLGGYPELRRRLPRELQISSGLLRAGIVVDANTNVADRWRSIRDRIIEVGADSVPTSPPSDGWVGSARLPDRTLDIGAWLMPDNQTSGALEEFAMRLVSGEDDLLRYAETCIDGLPEKRFRDGDAGKALLHTWLAWQDPPRLAIGEAISRRLFDPEAPSAQVFVAWVRHLFAV